MDFGRVADPAAVSYTLPPDHAGSIRVLGGIRQQAPQVYAGGVLWASDSFPGTIYPAKARPADYVKHYTQQFNTIELNATHYRMPSSATVERWRDAAPAGFKFCPKLHQSVSHANNLLAMVDFQKECNALFSLLGDKLGPLFMQLPPHFSPDRLPELLGFLDRCALPGMAVELRHPAWFMRTGPLSELSNYLYKRQLGLVLTDTPGRRDVLHMRLANKIAFIRFNGHNSYAGDQERMQAWAARAALWIESGLEQFYFFVHTPRQLLTPRLVADFIGHLHAVSGIKLQPPLLQSPGGKASLF